MGISLSGGPWQYNRFDKLDEASKPDYLDFDKDGDKKEPMKKALKEKGKKPVNEKKELPDFLKKKVDEKKDKKSCPKCEDKETSCGCKEKNMKEWHSKKFHKYDPLVMAIRRNGWQVQFFAIEVGGRGYCAVTVKSCFLRLGIPSKSVTKIMKSLSNVSLKRSFEIWLSRESFKWSNKFSASEISSEQNSNNKLKTNNSTKEKVSTINIKKNSNDNNIVSPVDFNKTTSEPITKINCGILNKGNTCYLNACLQCLSTMVVLWSNLTMCTNRLVPFVSSFVKIMSLLRSSKGPIDPSIFIKHLNKTIIDSGKSNFDIFQQQDAAEILSCILDELCSVAPVANNMVQVSLRTEITCEKCGNDNVKKEETTKILQVPVEANLQSVLNSFLAPETLSGGNSYFCNFCQSYESAVISYNLSSVGRFLILQTKRFLQNGSGLVKQLQKIACNQTLTVPTISNNIVENKKFKLLETINHTGSLNRGLNTPIYLW